MLKVEIYVDGTRLDLFKDENISITDTIQDIRDPGTIFTTFSQTFTVPASKTNNQVFKHYYNNKIIVGGGGFDARYSHPATIKINGVDFKSGTIKLSAVGMKKNKAYSYTVNFVGDGADIKNAVTNDDLSVLSYLDIFNHEYNLTNVKGGLEDGLGLNTSDVMEITGTTDSTDLSIIYPLISHTKRYVYDAGNTGAGTFKLYNPAVTAGTEGLEYNQLKPAIKLIHIIEAIENKYDIAFSRDFFGDSEFTDLYMWLNRTKGHIEGLDDNTTKFQNFTFTSNVDNLFDVVEYPSETVIGKGFYTSDYTSGPKESWILTFTTTITGSGNYDFYVDDYLKGGSPVYISRGNSGNQSFAVSYAVSGPRTNWSPVVRIESPGTITDIDVSLSAERSYYTPNGNYPPTVTTGVYDIPNVAPNNYAYITALIPKMTVMNFLSGIFKMFNLTHYKKADGTVYVDTLDNFYALGSDIETTDKIDITDSSVEVSLPFDYVAFKHSEPKTFLTANRTERLNDVFGDEEYRLTNVDGGLLFGGGSYEINTGFSHMMFESLEDLNDGTYPEILFGWAVDEDENPFADAPLILYHRGQTTVVNNLDFDDESEISSYQSLGNTDSTAPDGNSLHFGIELDEVSLVSNKESLYATYWENYIYEVYGAGARLVRYTAYLTPSFILNYNLYDRLIINGISHKINSITIDLLDGKSQLELITEA